VFVSDLLQRKLKLCSHSQS
jgi:hypothetical protein